MGIIENLNDGDKLLYEEGFFSGEYNQDLYLKKAIDDGSHRPKYYISACSLINGVLVQQGYLYFFLDHTEKTSYFIGVKVEEQFRNLNIGSFLVSSWIDLCLNNGYNFLGVHHKQRKPFLLYLLKTYGFEVWDKSLYTTRPDVISLYRSLDFNNHQKYLLFKDEKHEKTFAGTNIYKTDNYEIIHAPQGMTHLDDVIIPLQNMSRNAVNYELLNPKLAEDKTIEVLNRHRR